jgi:site-specific DNA-cytosine methylase
MSLKKYTQKDFHAAWTLLRNRNTIESTQLDAIGDEIFKFATRDNIRDVITLCVEIGFLSKKGNKWLSTDIGKDFASASAWRAWNVPDKIKNKFYTAGLSNLFIDPIFYKKRPKIIDLFSGAGGLGYSFEAEGFKSVLAVDNDKEACEAHELNFPECHVAKEDITVIANNPSEFIYKKYKIKSKDIAGIVGGPPCQGFSHIGERASSDERNLLTSRFMDIVLDIEPKFFVMENVAGLMTAGILPELDTHLCRLAKNIGEPASEIVGVLPKVPSSLAKRDRQYKKRLVSDLIVEYKSKIGSIIKSKYKRNTLCKLINCLYDELYSYFIKAVENEYASANYKEAINAISNSTNNIAIISITSLFEYLTSNDMLPKQDARQLLLSINRDSSNKTVSVAAKNIIEDYDKSPKPEIYENNKIGPILYHLIQRASSKYTITLPQVLNAANYGAPQSRNRLFFVGIHKSIGNQFVFPKPTHQLPGVISKKEFLKNLPFAPTSFEAIGDLPNIDDYEKLITDDDIAASNLKNCHSNFAALMRIELNESPDKTNPRPTWNPFSVDCCLRTLHADHALERMEGMQEGKQDHQSKRNRLDRNKVSNTLRAGTKEGKGSHTAVRPIHYENNRVICVREGARLMGYPDWMTFHRTKWHGFRLVGNGVPTPLGRAIARAIMEQLT